MRPFVVARATVPDHALVPDVALAEPLRPEELLREPDMAAVIPAGAGVAGEEPAQPTPRRPHRWAQECRR